MIELLISEQDKEIRKEHWKSLNILNAEIYRAANLIVTNQLFNDFYENRYINKKGELKHLDSQIRSLYMNKEKNVKEIKELKEKKKERWEEAKKFYDTSKQNVTYRITSRDFPQIPAGIVTALNTTIVKNLKQEWNDVKSGNRTLRTYRKGMPIPFNFGGKRKWLREKDGEIYVHWCKGIIFKLHFGRDRSNNKIIVDKCLTGEYKYSDSSIQLKDKKIFLLLAVDIPQNKNDLDDNISVGVDLGVTIPAYCALSDGKRRLAIGSKDVLLRVRMQMQNRRRNLQRRLKMVPGGKGRNKKLKTLDTLTKKEKNYVTTYNHMISHNAVKFAKDNRAATIKLEFLEGYGQEKKNKFILRNWSYFQLQTMIEYKAKMENIKVVYVDPYHTSQTCAECNNYEEGQRERQEQFICKNEECRNYNEKVNADFNAGVNISRSAKVVTSKEQCEYYSKNKE